MHAHTHTHTHLHTPVQEESLVRGMFEDGTIVDLTLKDGVLNLDNLFSHGECVQLQLVRKNKRKRADLSQKAPRLSSCFVGNFDMYGNPLDQDDDDSSEVIQYPCQPSKKALMYAMYGQHQRDNEQYDNDEVVHAPFGYKRPMYQGPIESENGSEEDSEESAEDSDETPKRKKHKTKLRRAEEWPVGSTLIKTVKGHRVHVKIVPGDEIDETRLQITAMCYCDGHGGKKTWVQSQGETMSPFYRRIMIDQFDRSPKCRFSLPQEFKKMKLPK